MIEQKVLTWDSQDPEHALTLPSRYFFDQEIFDKEVERIFTPAWHCVCHDCEIPEAGDFVNFEILGQSVLVVRGEDGGVHALHNVCRHRGTRLVQARRGRLSSMITCPYHAWSYHLDGRLRHAPRCEKLADFRREDWGLVPVRLENYAGFWFVNFDPDAAPAAEQFAGAEEAMRPFFPDLDDLRFVEEVDMYVDANWKVIVDNQIEGYHFKLSGPHHKELAALIDFDGYTLTQHGKWWDFVGPPRDVDTAFGHPVKDEKYQTNWFYNIQLWPTTTFYAFPYADAIGSFNQIPLGPERTLLRFGHYVPKSRPQSELSKAAIAWFNEKLGPEDIDLNLYVQRGLHSMAFDQGRYMIDAQRGPNSEHLLHHFHTLVYQAIHR
ncbi:aromatic ring-hydroxylating dioxygenase subunit alpha [Rhodosalinus halophilus]|uniref:Aromatic ring-hydroxylating dioxygenase subunit alpha n=1 Tax=Rhodosalinus halophilus TaxID=2259333 RepID=A0A365UBS3_9RHOB|nr:aromatic ring-hydroxylating dioxygenase subunit alpha [Rhodosalinus halophilus]RBI86381.1 aromatic ring-hydroxylating dioxygenase subunit alpha [Rhodosalinus halophilus]